MHILLQHGMLAAKLDDTTSSTHFNPVVVIFGFVLLCLAFKDQSCNSFGLRVADEKAGEAGTPYDSHTHRTAFSTSDKVAWRPTPTSPCSSRCVHGPCNRLCLERLTPQARPTRRNQSAATSATLYSQLHQLRQSTLIEAFLLGVSRVACTQQRLPAPGLRGLCLPEWCAPKSAPPPGRAQEGAQPQGQQQAGAPHSGATTSGPTSRADTRRRH